jgi:catechol 2,3-dioxygenase-like lactoylglutathione lyase family enzyme
LISFGPATIIRTSTFTEEPMSHTIEAVGQIALPVANPDRSQEFYGETLGLPFLYRYGPLVFFSVGNLRLMLSGGEATPVTPSNMCVYFRVDDLDRAHAELQEGGLVFQDKPKLIARMPDHELWMAFFRDPDGHLLALMQEKR